MLCPNGNGGGPVFRILHRLGRIKIFFPRSTNLQADLLGVSQFPSRKVRNHVRISSMNNSGSSMGAKCPLRGISVQRCT
jgi:hypothetical protein